MFSTADRRKWEATQVKNMKKFLVEILKTTQAQITVQDLVHNYKHFGSCKYCVLMKMSNPRGDYLR